MEKAGMNAKKEDIVIHLSGNLSIYEVGAVRDELLTGLVAGKSVSIDLEQVEEWDVAGLQLLVATQKTASNTGTFLRFDNLPDQLRAALPLLGLDSQFFPRD